VREAIVLAQADQADNHQLVAYLMCDDGQCAAQSLQQQLALALPAHMVPALWVFLDALPLSPSGKVDRHALPKAEMGPQDRGPSDAAPKTALEEVVASVWAELLKVDQIDASDNFFVLGGHSLLATQIIARLAEKLGVTVSLRVLLDDRTVRGLAASIERVRSEPSNTSAQPSTIAPRRSRSAGPRSQYDQERRCGCQGLERTGGAGSMACARPRGQAG
jgi:acyl carrier protein